MENCEIESGAGRTTVDLKHCWHGGGSTPVVLLHGLGSRGEDWAFQLPPLTPNFRVLTLDLRGHGDSPNGPGWPTVADMASDVCRLLREQSAGPAHVVGLSLGAAIGLQLGLDHPGSVRSLTLINGFARLRTGWRGAWSGAVRLLLLLAGRMDLLGRWVARTLFPGPGTEALRRRAAARIAANERAAYLRALWALLGFDARRRLAEFEKPALVVAGAQDPVVPERAKLELFQGLPRAEYARIEGSGHATPLDAPEALHRVLLDFLLRVENSQEAAGAD